MTAKKRLLPDQQKEIFFLEDETSGPVALASKRPCWQRWGFAAWPWSPAAPTMPT